MKVLVNCANSSIKYGVIGKTPSRLDDSASRILCLLIFMAIA